MLHQFVWINLPYDPTHIIDSKSSYLSRSISRPPRPIPFELLQNAEIVYQKIFFLPLNHGLELLLCRIETDQYVMELQF